MQAVPMIRKPLADIVQGDLEGLIRDGWFEDEQLDFKASIPHKDGENRDPWRNPPTPEGRRIKEYGRDQLLATVVAFANSYGGDLLIGVREAAASQPGRAEALDPLPDCYDCARRISQAANECIEPPLAALQVRAIATGADGAGVVILRTPHSRGSPHRLRTVKDCYHRVRHETLSMTMRQIQDLTLSVSRALDLLEKRLAQSRDAFSKWTQTGVAHPDRSRLCFRVTAIPVTDDVYMEQVHNVPAVRPGYRAVQLQVNPNGRQFGLPFPLTPGQWRPVIRGTQGEAQAGTRRIRTAVYCDGTVSYEYVAEFVEPAQGDMAVRPFALYPGWHFATVVNAVETLERVRQAAGVPSVEYALEIELVTTRNMPVLRMGGDLFDPAGELPAGVNLYPQYVVGSADTWRDLYRLMWRDFWNSIGIEAATDDPIVE